MVKDFVSWCELDHLHLNVTKTKELSVDFGVHQGDQRGHSENKLDRVKNTGVYRKDLRRLRSFNTSWMMLRIIYESAGPSYMLLDSGGAD